MSPKPVCLYCEARIDPDRGVLVFVEGTATAKRRTRDMSWTCGRPACLERLAKAAEEEECFLLRPQGIFDPQPRADGSPPWLMWIAKEKTRDDLAGGGLFSAMYRPFTLTAR